MAKVKAYTKLISPNGTDKSENNAVHQSSPTWVLTFTRWDVRDTLRSVSTTAKASEILQVREPLVVENDCIQVSVNVNKSNLTHSMNATLVQTDVNYATSIAPGDFVLVNMLNWERDARRIVNTARNKNPGAINSANDGFKGLYKIQSVRKTIVVSKDGTKQVFIRISGFAFTEFNNSLYYNPYIGRTNQGTPKDDLLFASNLQSDFKQLLSADKKIYCQDIIKALAESFIGTGITDQGQTATQSGDIITANTHYYMPQQIGSLLGQTAKIEAAKDIYSFLFGIQKYSGSATSLALGMNPSNLERSPRGRFRYTTEKCNGTTQLKADYWNQVKAWSVMNQYLNSPLNEMYSCFKLDPSGRVMPTIVFRQIPFTSNDFGSNPNFESGASVTKFLSLPRWKISSALITSVDLGREEAARVNFVQYFGQPPASPGKADGNMSAQIAAKNYVYDVNDVKRSGLKPYVVSTSFEDLGITSSATLSREWALIVGDAVIGGHLKLNGTIECAGIVDAISVGDNLEYDGTVFHIEEISHVCGISSDTGVKSFRTSLKLSNGVSISDEKGGLTYAEMVHTRAYQEREDNYNNRNQSLPGVSESQDTSYRPENPDPSKAEIEKKDRPFSQPGKRILPIKEDDNE